MTYADIKYFSPINDVDMKKVSALAKSISVNGYVGCPILIYGEQLLTGSHRLAALKSLEESGEYVDNMEVAEDVTDIVDAAITAREDEYGWAPDIEFDNIGWLLKGSWVEKYKDELVEW